ncbi:fungal specific transcription factor [Aspergillus sclerotialis]|uniref:Fungal specific transcription factor n=1 Tax=Aspergillus sclerotialis TaxID=2070753 RepID=A0A3A2ZPM5_9EURO|nr:fungal specific transcription factor [Aspergillus sclerotialis]
MAPRQKNSRTHRKHVTTACIPCRDGKVKVTIFPATPWFMRTDALQCDGGTPTCRNCDIKGKNCRYRQSDDKRKVQVRAAVGLLARRVDSLVQYIRECGLPVPTIGERDYLLLKSILEALEVKCNDLAVEPDRTASTVGMAVGDSIVEDELETRHGATSTTGRDRLGRNCSEVDQSPSSENAETPTSSRSIAGTNNRQATQPLQETAHPVSVGEQPTAVGVVQEDVSALAGATEDGFESDDEVTDQFSCRLGRLQLTHDGQLRYFGSTSNLTLLDALVDVTPPSSVQRNAPEVLENAKLGKEIDEGFETHLLEHFFAWADPSVHVVEAETFWRSRTQSRYEGLATPYYSRALSDAMCALGAAYEPRYHPEFVTFPRSLAGFFGDRAKILLELELESPSIATIQTLVILSNHEASCTRDTRGWLYSDSLPEGMAMRLAFDLGLHLEMGPYVEKGIVPYRDAEVRRMIFWGVYLNEQFWGFYLGRSPQSRMEAVTVQKSASPNSLPQTKWRPYAIATTPSFSPVPSNLLCQQWVALYEIMIPLTDVLYGCSEISKHALQELTANTVDRLQFWRTNLPPDLRIAEGYGARHPLPHVLILHMQHHQFMIHCHRPYISRRYIQPQPPQGPGPNHARRMCIESATAIVKVLTIYEKAYGFRRANVQIISFVFSAALILIFTTVPTRSTPYDQELVNHLNTCFRALDDMSSCFENARRTSAFLTTLQRQWQIRRQSRTTRGGKRNLDQSFGHAMGTSREMPWNPNTAPWVPSLDLDVSAAQDLGVCMGSGADDPVPDYSSIADDPPTIDFMDPDLCNILLSEGIPRAFV